MFNNEFRISANNKTNPIKRRAKGMHPGRGKDKIYSLSFSARTN
jgi:hypothetical protein